MQEVKNEKKKSHYNQHFSQEESFNESIYVMCLRTLYNPKKRTQFYTQSSLVLISYTVLNLVKSEFG